MDNANDLGDITTLEGAHIVHDRLDGDGSFGTPNDGLDYYRFTLTEARHVSLSLDPHAANADLFLVDDDGTVLYSSTESGTASEAISVDLHAGTYYVRVYMSSHLTGVNPYTLEYQITEAEEESEVADLPADVSTTGVVEVGGFVVSTIETLDDVDAFAVDLVAGQTYRIDLEGSSSLHKGTLDDPLIVGLLDPQGQAIPNTRNDNGGVGENSQLVFTASESGTYHILAGTAEEWTEEDEWHAIQWPWRADRFEPSTYTLSVIEIDPVDDYAADTSTTGRVPTTTSVAGARVDAVIETPGDVDWFAVDLEANEFVEVRLANHEFGVIPGADPTDLGGLEDPLLVGIYNADGELIPNTRDDNSGRDTDSLLRFHATEAGTYYIAAASALPGHTGHYGVIVYPASGGSAPTFGQASYEFSLAENADGSTNRVLLGAVAASDPDNDTVEYSIAAGNPLGLFNIGAGNLVGLFEIDAGTGELFYVGRGEDYEAAATQFDLTIRASDGSLHSDVTVTVNVTDVVESVSELAGEDLPDGVTTTGRVAVGDTVTGEVGAYFDTDWFAVDLVAGRTYVIDLRGNGTGDGSLRDPKLKGVYDSDGTWISGQRDDDGGDGLNSRLTITATETATHYIGAGAHLTGLGTYELEVTDTTGDTATVDPVDDFAAESTTTGVLVPDTDTGVALAYGDIDSGGDVDWFAIDLEANQSVVLRLTGYNPETRSYDGGIGNPQIKGIYDSDENLLPGSSTSDPHAYQSFGSGSRILEIGTYGGGPQEARLVFRATEAGTYYVAAGSLYATETGKYTLAVSPGPAADDFSDNTATDGAVTVGGSVQGNIEWEDDADWFAVELTAGVRYEFDLAGPEDSREYPVFGRYIWDGQGNPYASWRSGTDSVVDPDNTIDHGFFTPLNSGTYYISGIGRELRQLLGWQQYARRVLGRGAALHA